MYSVNLSVPFVTDIARTRFKHSKFMKAIILLNAFYTGFFSYFGDIKYKRLIKMIKESWTLLSRVYISA